MRADRKTLFARLKTLGIETVTVEHAPTFTVAQSGALRETLPGAHTKSLFVVDKEGRMVLVVAKDDTRVDLKALAKHLGLGRLSFGKPELLEAVLGVPGGSVTPFALINESAADVTVVVDKALMAFAEVNCHPLENTATTRLATPELLRFIAASGHEPRVFALRRAVPAMRAERVAKRAAAAHLCREIPRTLGAWRCYPRPLKQRLAGKEHERRYPHPE